MFRALEIIVRAGEQLSASTWNAFALTLRSLRLREGKNVRLRETPDGTLISVDAAEVIWDHFFRVTLNGEESATITPGFVGILLPKIDGVPLDGGKDKLPPVLKFSEGLVFDLDGIGYVALEVKCDERWALKEAKIVQVAYISSDDGIQPPPDELAKTNALGGVVGISEQRARWPLAMLRRRSDGTLSVLQIVMHNLQHRVTTQGPNKNVGRHFFFV